MEQQFKNHSQLSFLDDKYLSFRLVDEQAQPKGRPRICSHPLREDSYLNFLDIFEYSQSQNQQKKKSFFFQSKKSQQMKSSKMQLEDILNVNMPNLRCRKKTIKKNSSTIQMLRQIETVFLSKNLRQDLQQFLKSSYFTIFIRLIIIINLIAIIITDYSFRIEGQPINSWNLSSWNIVSLNLQLLANCVFSLEILLQLYVTRDGILHPYFVINSLGSVACWGTIFMDMIYYDQNAIFQLLTFLKLIRAFIRQIEVFPSIKRRFEVLVGILPSLKTLFFPLIIIMLFYAIIGTILFSEAKDYTCQPLSSNSSNSSSSTPQFCGSSFYTCPNNYSCINSERSLTSVWQIQNFDNIGNSLITVYHFIFLSNMFNIMKRYSRYINPYISSLFFISMAIFLFYIFTNLIMISLSKAYHQENQRYITKEKEKKEEQDQDEQPLSYRIVKTVKLVIIAIQSVIITVQFRGMDQKLHETVSLLDFVFSWGSLIIILLEICFKRKEYFRERLNILAIVTIGLHYADFIQCGLMSQSVIYSKTTVSCIMRSTKILRTLQLIYMSPKILPYQKRIMKIFIQTLSKLKSFIVFFACLLLMFLEIGQLLFAYKIRFSNNQVNMLGKPYVNNFQSYGKSIINIMFLFYNQQWSLTMVAYFRAVGWVAVVFYTATAFVAYVMLLRLYIAVFLCYFKEELHKKEKSKMKTILNMHNQLNKHNIEIANRVSKGECEQSKSESLEQSRQPSKQAEETLPQVQYIFWCIPKKCDFLESLRQYYNHKYFSYLMKFITAVHCISIMVRNSGESPEKANIFNYIQLVCSIIYLLEVIVGCLCHGIFFEKNSYITLSNSNKVSFVAFVMAILSYMPFLNSLTAFKLRRFTIIRIFSVFKESDKEMTIVLQTIFQISRRLLTFIAVYTFFLFLISIIPLKLLNNQSFSTCSIGDIMQDKVTRQQCLGIGGTWNEEYQSFENIFSSIALMYQLVSAEGWSVFLKPLWIKQNSGWEFFFAVVFFLYNICYINIFLGFIVETYLHLKDMAYNLHLLKMSQRRWLLIKNSINCLVPSSVIMEPKDCSEIRRYLFRMLMTQTYDNIFNYIVLLNALLYAITVANQNQGLVLLNLFKYLCVILFLTDGVIKIYSFRLDYFRFTDSKIEFIGFLYTIIWSAVRMTADLNNEQTHIFNFFLVCLLLARCQKLLFKYSWCKTLLNSIMDILPKCDRIIRLAMAVLFFYAAIGLELFKNTKANIVIDNYSIGFNNFLTSFLTLVRVSTSQGWFQIVSAYLKPHSPSNSCFNITTVQESVLYANEGCGTWLAYPFFISFHIIMVLLIMNLLIARMASAYDENYEIQYNSVNIFQLQDCLKLWMKYDQTGKGVVQFKKFWKLTSEIAILFGINRKKLIKRKKKFLQELDLQIYTSSQPSTSKTLCYRFHDVITKFSKIKLQIQNLNYKEEERYKQLQIEFDINNLILKEIQDFITPFPHELYEKFKPWKNYKSGETKYVFDMLKKLRNWKYIAGSKKKIPKQNKLSSLIDKTIKNQESRDHKNYEIGYFRLKEKFVKRN